MIMGVGMRGACPSCRGSGAWPQPLFYFSMKMNAFLTVILLQNDLTFTASNITFQHAIQG